MDCILDAISLEDVNTVAKEMSQQVLGSNQEKSTYEDKSVPVSSGPGPSSIVICAPTVDRFQKSINISESEVIIIAIKSRNSQ